MAIRVLFDARSVEVSGGVRRYVLELLRALSQRSDVEVVAAVRPRHRDAVAPLAETVTSSLPRGLWEQLALPRLARRADADVIHATKHVGPVASRVPVVVTVHDLMYFTHRHLWGVAEGLYWRTAMRLSVPRAAAVVVPSQHAKDELARLALAPPERTFLTYYGASDRFVPGRPEAVEAARRRWADGKPYLLTVGKVGRKKNLPVVIEGVARAARLLGKRMVLIAVGRSAQPDPRIAQALNRAAPSADVRFTGWIADDELLLLYQGAELFVFGSVGEGFGLPVVEAMRCGVPVVTSVAGSLREVLGPGGIGVEDPHDADAFAAAIVRLLRDEDLRRAIRRKALQWAAQFTWQRCAEETVRAYRFAVEATR